MVTTKEQKTQIREAFTSGTSVSEIAKAMNLPYRYIYSICKPHKTKKVSE